MWREYYFNIFVHHRTIREEKDYVQTKKFSRCNLYN